MVYNKKYYDENKEEINNLARINYLYEKPKWREYYKKFEKPTECECGDIIKNLKWVKYHEKSNKHINNLKLKSINELEKNLDIVLQDNINKEKELLEKNERTESALQEHLLAEKLLLQKLDKLIIKPLELSELSYRCRSKRKY